VFPGIKPQSSFWKMRGGALWQFAGGNVLIRDWHYFDEEFLDDSRWHGGTGSLGLECG
jgi:hypothetical protein